MTSIHPRRPLLLLQIARALAAILVVLDHVMLDLASSEKGIIGPEWRDLARSLGTVGVMLFFAISGFIMYKTNLNKFGSASNALDFVARRLIRIFPLYAFATFLQFVNKHDVPVLFNAEALLKSLLFIPFIGEGGHDHPILGQGWTLNYEIFFYLLFAIALCMPRAVGVAANLTLLALIAALSFVWQPEGVVLGFYVSFYVAYFAVGILAGVLHNSYVINRHAFRHASICWWTCYSAVSLAVAAYYFPMPPILQSLTIAGLMFVAIFVITSEGTEYRETAVSRVGHFIGDASFSIYLFHGFIIGAFKKVYQPSWPVPVNIALAAIGFCVALAVGCVIYRFLEQPVQRRLSKAYQDWKVISSSPLPR